MSGKQLVETLRQLGYPDVEKLEPQMFNWMFENDAVSPFLQWFCSSITKSNILLPSELQQFSELENSEEGILEGIVLDDALRNFSLRTDEPTLESLSTTVNQLEQELEQCTKKKELLIHRRDRLNIHNTGLGHRLSRLTEVESLAKREYQKSLEQLEDDDMEMNENLQGLVRSAAKIHTLYEEPVRSQQEEPSPQSTYFLSHVDLQDYYEMEDKFSHELKMFTKKRFFDGVAELAGQNEVSKYELLEVADPECLLVRGEKQEVILQDSRELARLKAVYPVSQIQLIEALVSEKQVLAAITHTQKLVQQLQTGDFPTNINKLRENLQESHVSKTAVTRDLLQLQNTDIPTLTNRSADLQGSNIITGDYKLKLARQGYFTSNQDQLIEELVVQRARNEFLTMAYEIEGRNHRDTHRLLTAIRKTLHQHLRNWQERQKAMEDPSITPARQQRGTIDSRDKSTARLHQLLNPSENEERQQLFLAYSGLVEGAQKLDTGHRTTHAALAATLDKHQQKADMLEAEVGTCMEQLYHGSSTTSGDPILTPPLLQETSAQLDAMLAKLEASIMDVIKDHDAKKKLLKANPLQAKERDLFIYFYTRPAMLKQTIDTILERLQAESVS